MRRDERRKVQIRTEEESALNFLVREFIPFIFFITTDCTRIFFNKSFLLQFLCCFFIYYLNFLRVKSLDIFPTQNFSFIFCMQRKLQSFSERFFIFFLLSKFYNFFDIFFLNNFSFSFIWPYPFILVIKIKTHSIFFILLT